MLGFFLFVVVGSGKSFIFESCSASQNLANSLCPVTMPNTRRAQYTCRKSLPTCLACSFWYLWAAADILVVKLHTACLFSERQCVVQLYSKSSGLQRVEGWLEELGSYDLQACRTGLDWQNVSWASGLV